MKIAVVGCGAVGSFYGAKLGYAGETVHFLLRSDYAEVRRNGLLVRSSQGDFRFRPKCARAPAEIGVADLVLVALKTTANDQLSNLLPPLIGPQTALVTLQNGLGNEEFLTQFARPQQILGGLCFVCLNRLAPGVIQHIDHGRVVLGEFSGWPEPRTHDLAALFRRAGVPCEVTDNLARAHWEKLVWNIPFNGLGVASAAGYENVVAGHPGFGDERGPCLTTDRLLADARWANLVRELMGEVIGTARRLGWEVPFDFAEELIQRTQTMGAYKPSTLIDFEQGRPLELESMFLRPLREAERVAAPVPRLRALGGVLAALDPGRDLTAQQHADDQAHAKS